MGLDSVELILAVEDTFQVSIDDEEVSQILTVADLEELVFAKLAARGEAQEPDDVYEVLVDVIAAISAAPRASIYRQARIVTDLGIN